jgi:hypothetical protein
MRWPSATGLASYLSGCLSFTDQRSPFFGIAGVPEGSQGLALTSFSFPALTLFLSRLSASFVWRIRSMNPPESYAPCWHAVATVYPLGNCDSLKLETLLSYLSRLRTVSHRSLPPEFLIRVTDGARTPPEELVNPASAPGASQRGLRGAAPNQPGSAFPQSPGIIFEARGSGFFTVTVGLVLSMNWE